MRLICPNCEAQYEVDDNAIPETGRDVQCSNCEHAWFQLPDNAKQEDAGKPEDTIADTEKVKSTKGKNPAPATAGAEISADADKEMKEKEKPAQTLKDAPGSSEKPASPPPKTVDQPLPPRRTLDESLLAVLKEEAEREAAARRAEARPLETQTDLGLDEVPTAALGKRKPAEPPAPKPKTVKESNTGTEDRETADHDEAERPAARRDLLPDLEEINSTLSASNEERPGETTEGEATPSPRSAFRGGFVLMIAAAALFAALYFTAPRIVEEFPASHDVMSAYVGQVDQWRGWLDRVVHGTGSN
ncbi:MAG: zinc-ribbon domain-containing protein [Pseudorhodobacter sp.]